MMLLSFKTVKKNFFFKWWNYKHKNVVLQWPKKYAEKLFSNTLILFDKISVFIALQEEVSLMFKSLF